MTIESSSLENNNFNRTKLPETTNGEWWEHLTPECRELVQNTDEKVNQIINEGKIPTFTREEYRGVSKSTQLYQKSDGHLTNRKYNQVAILPRVWRNFPVALHSTIGFGEAEKWLRDASPMTSEYSRRNFLLHRNPDSTPSAQAFLHTLREGKIHHVVTLKNNYGVQSGRKFWLYKVNPGETLEVKTPAKKFKCRINDKRERDILTDAEREELSNKAVVKLTLLETPLHTLVPSMSDILERGFLTKREFCAEFSDGEKYTFTHIQVNGWRDMGLVDLNALFQACLCIPENAPVAAHCQGGVGRAGTFAAVLTAMDYFRNNQGALPPVTRLFSNLRSQRPIIEYFTQLNLVSMAMNHMRKRGLELSDEPNREFIEAIRKMSSQECGLIKPSTVSTCYFLKRIGVLKEKTIKRVTKMRYIPYNFDEDKAVKLLKYRPRIFDQYNTMMDGLTEYARREFFDLSTRVQNKTSTFKLLWKLAGKGVSLVDLQEKFIPRINGAYQSDEELEKNVGLFGLLWSGRFDVAETKLQQVLTELEQNTASTS